MIIKKTRRSKNRGDFISERDNETQSSHSKGNSPSATLNGSQAGKNDGQWFFVEYASQADKKIFFTEYANQADVLIYFTEYASQAKWKKKEKMHLFY